MRCNSAAGIEYAVDREKFLGHEGSRGRSMIFQDRREAGRILAQALRSAPGRADLAGDAIVLGLPRGGVPVAYEVARELRLPLDVFVVRKLGVPGQEELAMGAMASGGLVVLNEPVIRAYGIRPEAIEAVAAREHAEIERREALWREGRAPLALAGRTAILVDDGLATGSTMKAAARALRPLAGRVIAAVPVAAAAAWDEMSREVDWLTCVECPQRFAAVGEFYTEFDPTPDEEVRALLALMRQDGDAPRAA
jgi:putative phosphoribosyl transferase